MRSNLPELDEGEIVSVRVYPPAKQRIIPAGANDPKMRPVVVSLHVAVSMARSLYRWFRRKVNGVEVGIESHLYLRRDGSWEQYRELDLEADGQGGGNTWQSPTGRLGAIIIETQGMGSGRYGWLTRKQKAALKTFALWARDHLDIPLRVVRVPHPRTLAMGGWGYHSLFDEWNSLRKTCPGWRRIRWFKTRFAPWMREQNKTYVFASKGDTWAKIASSRDMSVPELIHLNQPEDGSRVRVR